MSSAKTDSSPNFDVLESKIRATLLSKNGNGAEISSISFRIPEELKGEHFATETAYAEIQYKDGALKPRNLFIKKFSSNALHTEWVKKMKVMEKESSFFNLFLPALQKFCLNYKGAENLVNFFPRCVYSDDDCIILDNMVLDDTYLMLDKEESQDLDTCKLVLSHLATFHGANHAMIEDMGREIFMSKFATQIQESFSFTETPEMAVMFDNGLLTCIKLLTDYPMPGGEETIAKLKTHLGHTVKEFEALLERDLTNPLLVLNHGDCWNNNMLFRKDPTTGKITEHIFVDLQITRYGVPNMDLGYYLLTSVKPHVRKAHHKQLLKHYFTVLTDTLELFGLKNPITFDELWIAHKKYSKIGYYTNLSFLSAIGAFKEIDMDDFGTDPAKAMENFNNIIHNWIAKNPDKAAVITAKIIDFVKEYEELQNSE